MRHSRAAQKVTSALLIAFIAGAIMALMHVVDTETQSRRQRPSRGSAPAAVQEPSAPATILLVGDVLPVGDRDYLARIEPMLKSADFVVGNLECPVATTGSRTELKLASNDRALPNEYFFRAPPVQARRLADAGFDAVTLANNHIMDYGEAALKETLKLLGEAGLMHAGAGRNRAEAREPIVANVRGQTIAVLAYVDADTLPGTATFAASGSAAGTVFVHGDGNGDPQEGTLRLLREDIGASRERADFVVVAFHWGTEGGDQPDRLQRMLARRSIEAGADVVVGHHPHVLQGVEVYGGRPIIYSLGNFAFPTPWVNNQFSAAAEIRIEHGEWKKLTWHPVRLSNPTGTPAPAQGVDAQRIIDRLTRLSTALGTEYETTRDQSAPLLLSRNGGTESEDWVRRFRITPHPQIEGMATVGFLSWDIELGERVSRQRDVVVAQELAEEVCEIFREIYESEERFPIHEVIGYDYRTVAGSQDRLSWHAMGRAIDINRAENPMIDGGEKIVHPDEPPYTPGEWRPGEDPYSISPDGSVVEAFTSRGWRWGGTWTTVKDYQHFDRPQ